MTYVISKNSQVVDQIINDPSVRPFVGGLGSGEITVANLFASGAFAVLAQEKILNKKGRTESLKYHGGAVLIPDGKGGLEAHTFALPSGRGGKVSQACDAVSHDLLKEDFNRIYGYTPVENEIACKFNEKIGFKKRKAVTKDLGDGPKEYFLYSRTN
ncbi:MAG: hypothetical protein V3T23_09310 [Nitrososphaerales archaeon]